MSYRFGNGVVHLGLDAGIESVLAIIADFGTQIANRRRQLVTAPPSRNESTIESVTADGDPQLVVARHFD